MKKLVFLISIVLMAQMSFAQGLLSWGIKGGVNSSKISFSDFSIDQPPTVQINPDYYTEVANFLLTDPSEDELATFITNNPEAIEVKSPQVAFEPASYEMGYHVGAFARIKIASIFLQPELIFSQTNASINMNPDGFDIQEVNNQVKTAKITYTNFDVPVMLGFKIGPAHICAGPVATFKLDAGFDQATKDFLEEVDSEEGVDVFTVTKNATFGAQVGGGLTILKKVTIDLRYEFGLSKLGDQVTISGYDFNTDQRQSQFIGSIGWIF